MNSLISKKDREIILSYLGKQNRQHCPPGLAKKNNGCLPPGQAKKYALGKKLSGDIGAFDLPKALHDLLKPPKGYSYKEVDKDVVLISDATQKVVDAISAVAAISN